MKVMFVGAARRHGTSKVGKPYDMCMFSYAVPIKPASTATMNYHGFGYEVKEVDLELSALNQFAMCKFGEMVDVDVQPDPANLTKNIVMGMIGKSPVGSQAKEEKF